VAPEQAFHLARSEHRRRRQLLYFYELFCANKQQRRPKLMHVHMSAQITPEKEEPAAEAQQKFFVRQSWVQNRSFVPVYFFIKLPGALAGKDDCSAEFCTHKRHTERGYSACTTTHLHAICRRCRHVNLKWRGIIRFGQAAKPAELPGFKIFHKAAAALAYRAEK